MDGIICRPYRKVPCLSAIEAADLIFWYIFNVPQFRGHRLANVDSVFKRGEG